MADDAKIAGAPSVTPEAYFDVVTEVSRFFSHNLGNLLTGLNLTLDMLASTAPDEARHAQLVQRSLTMMEALCRFKENWSGLGESGQHRFESLEPTLLIDAVLEHARLGSEFALSITCDPATPPLHCHPGLLESAMQYLVRNAVDAMPGGGDLGIDIRPDDDSSKITVWDSGPGIPVELQSKILYEPVTTKPYGGGIGLMLVAMIAKRVHRGEVRWTSRTPQGCSIEMTLPTRDASVARSTP